MPATRPVWSIAMSASVSYRCLEMSAPELPDFPSSLAVDGHVAASTHRRHRAGQAAAVLAHRADSREFWLCSARSTASRGSPRREYAADLHVRAEPRSVGRAEPDRHDAGHVRAGVTVYPPEIRRDMPTGYLAAVLRLTRNAPGTVDCCQLTVNRGVSGSR